MWYLRIFSRDGNSYSINTEAIYYFLPITLDERLSIYRVDFK